MADFNGANIQESSPTPTSPFSPADEKGFSFQQNQYQEGDNQAGSRSFADRIRRFFSLYNLLGIIWLAPALALLVLNFEGHIIGTSIGCLSCRIDPSLSNQVAQAQQLDKKDHNALGGLQFVAKALEVWFVFVAGSLVYNIMTRLAGNDRLPMSLLTAYAEFPGLLYLMDLADRFWDVKTKWHRGQNPTQVASNNKTDNDARNRYWLYFFMFIVFLLCILSNLIGVATAVLVLPTMQWVDINVQDRFIFDQLASSSSPADPAIAIGCNSTLLAAGDYSCTSNLYAANWDEMAAAAVSTDRQFLGRNGTLLPPVSQEDDLAFSVNISSSATTIWVPNRQVLRAFSVDWSKYVAAAHSSDLGPDYPRSDLFNNSLEARLQRNGPTVGLVNSCVVGNVSVFTIDKDRDVRCYPRANDLKCIRWGPGWTDNAGAASAKFLVEDAEPGQFNLTVTIYATNRARYLQKDDPCLNMGLCAWDTIFSSPAPPAQWNISGNQQTFEYNIRGVNSLVVCDTAAYLGFATYVLNPGPLSNILNLVELDILGGENDNATGLLVHPDWNLAAWSVDRDGVVPGLRGSAVLVIYWLQRWLETANADKPNLLIFNVIHQYSVLQALSMISYSTTNASSKNPPQQQQDQQQPVPTLKSWATIRVWKYGLDSRTSKVGTTVMILGCLCVLLSTVLYVEDPKSPTELIVAVLEHPSPGSTGPGERRPVMVKHDRTQSSFSFHRPGQGSV